MVEPVGKGADLAGKGGEAVAMAAAGGVESGVVAAPGAVGKVQNTCSSA